MLNLPNGLDINKLIDDLKGVSWRASEILLNYSQNLGDRLRESKFIAKKDNNEPVTLADLEVNNLIIDFFKKKYSNVLWDILSEELYKTFSENKLHKDWIWVLDPLDGTKDFIQGTGHFAMHLALTYKNKPTIGIVLIPEKDELWISSIEKVWCEKRNGSQISANLSDKKTLKEMTLVTSRNHSNELLNKLIEKIGFKKIIKMGSIGCKIASIVRGDADIYISLSLKGQSAPKDWDFAAPELILKKAGGALTDNYNRELSYNKKGFRQEGLIIASNDKENHSIICDDLKEIIRENNIIF